MDDGEGREARALRRADCELEQLQYECDQLDAMLVYLQRRRDEVEGRFAQRLADRDRLEAELWDHAVGSLRRDLWADAFACEPVEVSVSEDISLEIEIVEVEADDAIATGIPALVDDAMIRRRVVPPDLSRGGAPPPTPSATELLTAWGLQPIPPDLSDRRPPAQPRLEPQLASWELEDADTVAPEPHFVPVAETRRIAVVPGGLRARSRPHPVVTQGVPIVDTAPIWLASRRAARLGMRTG